MSWWWPALPGAAVVLLVARHRSRSATAVLADLTEAAVDLYGNALAVQLGLADTGALDDATGLLITRITRKDRRKPAAP
ncbi:hypothetical protein [Actinoplanes sp. HUAS TT8]|uniref:hypothetical protein n=1 Tax=Actinoplanes sp. HUAS TT8 TaxID=3447453 RepID=UPI003F520F27